MYILFFFINLLCLNEFYNLSYKVKLLPYKVPGILASIIIYTLCYLVAVSALATEYLLLCLIVIPLLALPPLFYKSTTVFKSWGSTIFGIAYVSIPLSLIPFIAFTGSVYHYELLLGIFALIWIYDSFAYLTGTLVGKNRIFPSVSPKKTWEGAFGGLLFSVGAAILMKNLFGILNSEQWITLSVIIVVTGTTGDLIQSALKRNAGVKDSGNLMPGHGGALDRFDSFLFSVPFVFTYLYLIVL